MDNFNKDVISNGHSRQICRLAHYSCKFGKASHIFLKNGLWQMSASLASPSRHFGKFGKFLSQVVFQIFLGIKQSSLPLLNSPNLPNLPNLLNSLNTRQICLRESQEFGGSRVFANLSTRQKWRVLGKYSNSLNSRASCHCLIKTKFVY